MREDEVGAPLEVLRNDVFGRNAQLLTMRAHRSHVGIVTKRTGSTIEHTRANQVIVVTLIPVELHIDAVVQETQVDTDVELVLLLVGQVGVGEIINLQTRLLHIRKRTPGVVALDDDLRIVRRRLVTRQRVRSLQRGVSQHVLKRLLEPRLLVGVPCT